MNIQDKKTWLWGIGLGILFPLFFQLDGGIYRDVSPIINSQGVLAKLPLPISILTCLAVLAFLADGLERARPALAMIFGTIAVSFISLWLGSDGVTSPMRKLIIILQVVLPMAGLLLGQLVDDKDKVIARAFLVVLSIVVPWQLLATWLQGGLILTHDLYAFSIYSHFQYVTLIFVCAFAYSLTSLWDEHKVWLCVLVLPMLIYVTSGLPFLTFFAYASLLIAFAGYKLWVSRANTKLVLISLTLVTATAVGGLHISRKWMGSVLRSRENRVYFRESSRVCWKGKFLQMFKSASMTGSSSVVELLKAKNYSGRASATDASRNKVESTLLVC